MSSLLKEAIVDAKALRESALKNAENIVMTKYSQEVKKTLEGLLEQDELGMAPDPGAMGVDPMVDPMAATDPAATAPEAEDPMADPMAAPDMDVEASPEEVEEVTEDDIPFAATDNFSELSGKNLGRFPKDGEPTDVTIDLGALQEAIKELQEAPNEEYDISEKQLQDMFFEDDDGDDDEDPSAGYAAETDDSAAKDEASAAQDEKAMKGMEESTEIDTLVDAIAEKLTVDMGAELSGWAGRPTSELKHEQERELAGMQSDDVKEELEDLNKAQEKLVAENNDLKEQNGQYKQAIEELRTGLQDVNLSNARLLYTNRVLRDTSLNERQKNKIAEAISRAGSVTEAKTIYETLQSTVEVIPKKSPQSLSEAIGRRSTVIRATRKESVSDDPFTDRMKKLAGIK